MVFYTNDKKVGVVDFSTVYSMLYNLEEWAPELGSELTGWAAHEFDGYLEDHNEEVREFADERGDIIMSDREAAAFWLAKLALM